MIGGKTFAHSFRVLAFAVRLVRSISVSISASIRQHG
jgi:hypothetical protein